MKKLLLFISLFVSLIFFNAISETNSYFSSSTKLKENHYQIDITVDFYSRNDKQAVGFEIWGLSDFDLMSYKVSYNHGSLQEMVQSHVSLDGENSKKIEWIILGYCSSGGTCVFHEGITKVDLEILLKKESIIQKTLTRTINL